MPLFEACTLVLYQKNIFRVTGLPVDATSKEILRQAQKLQMLKEMGGGSIGPQSAFALAVSPTTDEIRDALSRMKEPEKRIIDEFFWYWPEEFGASKSDPAIQAMRAGDSEQAVRLWRDREKNGSYVALHNMAIMYHMFAVDWTNYHVTYDVDHALDDQIIGYWRKSFERWVKIVEVDELGDILKERVRSLGDEVLTTGFIRRMLNQLPGALNRVNAEAALKLAEQGRMDWAKFHVDFMRETHKGPDNADRISEMVLEPTRRRIVQHLESSKIQASKVPQRGAELATQLLDQCCPMMDLFDLLHGERAHQRNDIFDMVAETVLQMVVGHQKSTSDNKTFVELLERILKFASGANIREKINENILIGEGNLRWELLDPLFEELEKIKNESQTPALKFNKIKKSVLPKIPDLACKIGQSSPAYVKMMDKLALALREISIDAHNNANDFMTAENAIQLALILAVDEDVKKHISDDVDTIRESRGTITCFFCGKESGVAEKAVPIALHKITVLLNNGVRYITNTILVPRCNFCYSEHRSHWKVAWWGVVIGPILGAFIVPWSAVAGAVLAVMTVGGWLSHMMLKAGIDHRLGCLGIGGTLFGAYGCVNIANEEIGSNILFNMIGGAVVGAFFTFWIARKVLHKSTPEDLALKYDRIVALTSDGWKQGAKPQGYS